ncbi:hypothetical protein C2E23DRAFT_884343 [Lenzites betulinus]|nr:hypothetical protein C2E23DRAFT_884343 [Lenzites betulinus]
MRKPDPAFPSFTLMMNQWNNDTLRLPSYRESLVVRFHPYPRKESKSANALMKTVDYRYEEEPEVPHSEDIAPQASTDDVDDTALSLHRALSKGGAVVKRRRSLTALIIDLALALREGYRNSQVGKRRSSCSKHD